MSNTQISIRLVNIIKFNMWVIGIYTHNYRKSKCHLLLLKQNGDASKDFTPEEPWTLEITSATTGGVMVKQSSTSRSETISTAGWPKGIYVVKVTIGKEELTEKVLVK